MCYALNDFELSLQAVFINTNNAQECKQKFIHTFRNKIFIVYVHSIFLDLGTSHC